MTTKNHIKQLTLLEFVKREISTLLQPSPALNFPPYPPTQDFNNLGSRAHSLSQDIEMMQDRLLDISDLVGFQGDLGLSMDQQLGLDGLGSGIGSRSTTTMGLDNTTMGLGSNINPSSMDIQGLSPSGFGSGQDVEYVEPRELNFEDFFNEQQE